MWHHIENAEQGYEMVKTFNFNSFVDAFAFCTKVAMTAEKLNHHPTITIEYNTVNISTTTHDSGNAITDKDKSLMSEIDKIQS